MISFVCLDIQLNSHFEQQGEPNCSNRLEQLHRQRRYLQPISD